MENTQKNAGVRRRSNTKVRYMTQVGMLSAVATVLMLFDFPLPFVPDFYKIDISEIPVLLGTFAMGPLAGVMTECIKILLNFVINGTTTGGIGELANFLIGCSFCVPAGAFGIPLDTLVQMGHALNPAINGVTTFVILAVGPFNLIKGLLVSIILLLIYKKVSPILHGASH